MIRWLLWLGLVSGCAFSAAAWAPSDEFLALRAMDERVARIGYELATSNAEFCDNTTPATGLLLHDLGRYKDAKAMRAMLGVKSDIAVQAVVPNSPAAAAGLAPDMALASVAGLELADMALDPTQRWQRLETVRTRMSGGLRQDGVLALQVSGGDPLTLEGVAACTTHFEVGQRPGRKNKGAGASGDRVVVGTEFPGHAWPDELMAGLLAHELAHNVLDHPEWLDANGRSRKRVRATEREADRLSPWLLANAGYDPAAAARFIEAYRPASGSMLFISGTHSNWRERSELIAAEIASINALLASEGKADWKKHFRREELPRR